MNRFDWLVVLGINCNFMFDDWLQLSNRWSFIIVYEALIFFNDFYMLILWNNLHFLYFKYQWSWIVEVLCQTLQFILKIKDNCVLVTGRYSDFI